MEEDKKTILLIDDNKDFLTLSEEELASDQYNLETVLVGISTDVINRVRAAKPSIIFLDVLFSKNFSNSLASQIRKDEFLKDTPIYLMSFLDLAEIEAIANKREVNGCFMKPIKQSDIAQLLKTHFGLEITVEEE